MLCFDLPAQVFLSESYLTAVLGPEATVSTRETRSWRDLSTLRAGAVHFFGSWQWPLLAGFSFDLFWNAASIGEMESRVVQHDLGGIAGGPRWVYLLQARRGKETRGKSRVETPITFDDYQRMLEGHSLVEQQDAYRARSRLDDSGGYFEAVWRRATG